MSMKATSRRLATVDNTRQESVDTFLLSLEHPHKQGIIELRRIILTSDPAIAEGIKWKVPSFRTTEYFATMHLRAKSGFSVILHFGAKKRDDLSNLRIDDPDGLLKWLAKDRAIVTFRGLDDVMARELTFSALIRQWIRYV